MDDPRVPIPFCRFLRIFESLGLYPSFRKRFLFVLVLNVIVLMFLLYFYQKNQAVVIEHEFMEYFNDTIQMIVSQISIFIVYIETIHKREKYKELFRAVQGIDSALQKLYVNVSGYYQRSVRIFTVDFCILVTAAITMELLIYFNITRDQQWIVYWHVNCLPLALNRMRQLQLCLFIRIPSAHLLILEHLVARFLCKTIARGRRNQPLIFGTEKRLKQLKDIHIRIVGEMKIFNEVFNYSLAFHMFQNFVELLSAAYWLYYYNLDSHCVFGAYIIHDSDRHI